MNKFFPLIVTAFVIIIFFWQFFLKGLLPIPADTIIGLYHPFRDLYAKEYPRGIPFKNSLITDPVRQQYPWKKTVINNEKKMQLPLWNPYNMAGYPLLANFQSAVFYPLNILFFILPFNIAWGSFIFLASLLGGIFLYIYLKNLKLSNLACLLGAIVFVFSGFFIAWLEWGTIPHVVIWLPLILLAIDRIFYYFNVQKNSKLKTESASWRTKLQLKNQNLTFWSGTFAISLISSFFAGHLQVFFYLFVFSLSYLIIRWIQFGKQKKVFGIFLILYTFFFILTSVQWIPTFQFILESARDVDQVNNWQKSGWFVPWQHLVQFIVPDFFGNPTTNNYWGVWNYGEFIGYIGIFPLFLSVFALFFRRDKKTFYFGTVFFVSLILALPSFFAKIPFVLEIPFISTSQPTRLLFITDFTLAVLAALGLDYLLKNLKRTAIYPLIFLFLLFLGVWLFIILGSKNIIEQDNLMITKRNSVLPTILFVITSVLILVLLFVNKIKKYTFIIYILLIGLTLFDLFRFGFKFLPFVSKEYIFPQTKAISFLQEQKGSFRIMNADQRILTPNFSTIYNLQSIDGYDPLYLKRYGELIAASERGKPDISTPFGFNRIINPKNYDSKIIDLIGVKYILSLSDIKSEKLKKVFQEGQTRVYENINVFPRVFFVEEVFYRNNKNDVLNLMFDENFDLKKEAIIEDVNAKDIDIISKRSIGKAEIAEYSENRVSIKTYNEGEGFLILTDSFYPSWKVKIDGKDALIYRTNFNFRGIFVPKGEHNIEFYSLLL